MFNLNADLDHQEELQYRAGASVQLKQRPGVVDIIAEYDPMMVPPIWLVNDPKPRYPEELELVSRPVLEINWFKRASRGKVGAGARKSSTGGAKVEAFRTSAWNLVDATMNKISEARFRKWNRVSL